MPLQLHRSYITGASGNKAYVYLLVNGLCSVGVLVFKKGKACPLRKAIPCMSKCTESSDVFHRIVVLRSCWYEIGAPAYVHSLGCGVESLGRMVEFNVSILVCRITYHCIVLTVMV